ncbi:MAG: hypothetical protein LBU64_06365 [Planctomycetota bacterium]|nr:hypothetical protein [Planctomycetota bacterium]
MPRHFIILVAGRPGAFGGYKPVRVPARLAFVKPCRHQFEIVVFDRKSAIFATVCAFAILVKHGVIKNPGPAGLSPVNFSPKKN